MYDARNELIVQEIGKHSNQKFLTVVRQMFEKNGSTTKTLPKPAAKTERAWPEHAAPARTHRTKMCTTWPMDFIPMPKKRFNLPFDALCVRMKKTKRAYDSTFQQVTLR